MLNDEVFTPQNLEAHVERDLADDGASPVRGDRLWSHLDLTSAEPVVELDGSILAAAYRAFTERAPDSNGHYTVAQPNGHHPVLGSNSHRPIAEPNANGTVPEPNAQQTVPEPNDHHPAPDPDGQLSWPTATEFHLDLWPGEPVARSERSLEPAYQEIWLGEEMERPSLRPAPSKGLLHPFRRYRRYRHYRKYPWRKSGS
ncbi:MAG TPA: hypothetical protein DIU14_09715 [Actinobacteria bacterium]|nr:hypothetical protein [Actinomycetota bacterium]